MIRCTPCSETVILTTVTDITSTVGGGATVSTCSRRVTTPWRSVVKVTSRTVLEHIQLIGCKSQIGGIKHTCQVTTLESRSGVGEGPHLLTRQKPQRPMPMQLMNTPCHSGVHSESNVPDHPWDWWNDDQQRQWLQVQPWNNADPWNQYGIVASRTEHQQNHSWDQWNRWNADDWNRWSSWSAHGNYGGWSSRSQWHSDTKKYFDQEPSTRVGRKSS